MRALLSAAAAAACLSTSALGQNLFTNPSFETGDFTPWIKTGTAGVVRAADDVFLPRTGNFAVDNNSAGFGTTLKQTVPVQGGTIYELGLWLAWNRTSPNGGTMIGQSGGMVIGLDPVINQNVFYTVQTPVPPTEYFPVSTRVYIPAGQTSATVKFQLPTSSISNWVLSADDFYMTELGATVPAAAAQEVFAAGSALQGGGPVGTVATPPSLSLGGDGTIAARTSSGIIVRRPSGEYVRAAAPGDAAPGGGTFLFFETVTSAPAGGVVHFTGSVEPSAVNRVLATSGPGGLVEHARSGQALPAGGTLQRILDYRGDDAGRVVFMGSRSSSSLEDGLYRSDGVGALRAVAVGGTTNAQGAVQSVGRFWQNNTGLVAVDAVVKSSGDGVNRRNLYMDDGTATTVRVADGDAAPGTGIASATFANVNSPAINDGGALAFRASVAGSTPSRDGIWINASGANHVLALTDQSSPHGGNYTTFDMPVIGNGGHVAFAARTSDGGSGLFLTRAGEAARAIARADEPTPDGDVFGAFHFNTFDVPPTTKVLTGGQVAFLARRGQDIAESGLYLGDGEETLCVAKWGQTIDGKLITALSAATPRPSVGPEVRPVVNMNANDHGQVAYSATFAEGGTKHYLFTPTLHWRSPQSGNWSDHANWTVGLAPAHVHPVIIDSPHGVNVTTPAGETEISSLEVGVGNSLTLTAGSDLVVSPGSIVMIAGTLAGIGTITGHVTNAGIIAPGSSAGTITIAGDYLQAETGRLELELLDGAFDRLIVSGDVILGGDVFVIGGADVGQTFELFTADNIVNTATWHLPGESSYQVVTLPSGQQSVQVTYVPEPGVGAVGALAMLAMGRGSRGRKRG